LTDAYMMSVHVVDAMKLGPYWEQRFWTYVIAVLLSKNIPTAVGTDEYQNLKLET